MSIPRCTDVCKNGNPCTAYRKKGETTCGKHTPFPKDSECPICYESIIKKECKKLKCNHLFHKRCIDRWLGEMHKDTCPTCRAVIKTRRPRQVAQRNEEGQMVLVGETEEGTLWGFVDHNGVMNHVIMVN